jgi:hypothetical protein
MKDPDQAPDSVSFVHPGHFHADIFLVILFREALIRPEGY